MRKQKLLKFVLRQIFAMGPFFSARWDCHRFFKTASNAKLTQSLTNVLSWNASLVIRVPLLENSIDIASWGKLTSQSFPDVLHLCKINTNWFKSFNFLLFKFTQYFFSHWSTKFFLNLTSSALLNCLVSLGCLLCLQRINFVVVAVENFVSPGFTLEFSMSLLKINSCFHSFVVFLVICNCVFKSWVWLFHA